MLQTVNQRYYFIVGGVVSSVFFLLLLTGFVLFLFKQQKSITYALEKKTYISISLEKLPTPKRKKQKKSTTQKKPKSIKKPKRDVVDAEVGDVSVDSLFSNVWTKKIDTRVKKKKKVDAKRLAAIQKSVEVNEAEEKEPLKQLEKQTKKESAKSSSSGDEVNKYRAKIHSIIYAHFYPPQNSQGNIVKVVIELSPLGKVMGFRVVEYSQNEALNEEAKSIQERIATVMFPKNPDNKSVRVMIVLKPEDKE